MKTILLSEQEFRDILMAERQCLLDQIASLLSSNQKLDKKVNAREAASLLGISLSTLYKKIAQLPHRKFGKKLVFSQKELESLNYSQIN